MSFQEMHRQRQRATFVGRTSEAERFEQNFLLAAEDSLRRPIVGISGQGGMGKTTFLNRCREIAAATGAATAWSDEDEKDLLSVMGQMTSQLESRGSFTDFHKALERYRDIRHSLESGDDAPEEFGRILGAAAGRAGVKLARRIPGAGAAFDFVDEDGASEKLGEISSYVFSRAGKRKDAFLVLEPLETLTPLFLSGLDSVASTSEVALFFDTFEQTQSIVEPWLLRVLSGHYGDLPANLTIAMAGRAVLDPNDWAPYDTFLLRIDLMPFTEEESKEFLAHNGVTDPEMVGELIGLSKGLPILLASLAIGSPQDPQATDSAVERVLRSVPEPFRKVAIQAAIARRINRDIVGELVSDVDVDAAFNWLIGMPFVASASEGWKYHDLIRSELSQYGRRESPSQWASAHEQMSNYFAKERDRFAEAKVNDRTFEAEIERFYHGLCSGDSKEIGRALGRCVRSWNVDTRLCTVWALNIRQAEEDAGSEIGSWGQGWIDAINGRIVDDYSPAETLLSRVLESGLLPDRRTADALRARSDAYYQGGQLDKALADIDAAILKRKDDPELYFERAWVYWLTREDDDKALADCQMGLSLLDDDDSRFTTYSIMEVGIKGTALDAGATVDALNAIPGVDQNGWGLISRGRALRAMGAQDAAIRDFKNVIQLKSSRGQEAWIELGQTYEELSKLRQAVAAFRSAVEAYPYSASAWIWLAEALQKSVDKESIRGELLSVVDDQNDENLSAYRALGLLEVDQIDAAREELARAVEADPLRAEFRLWKARVEGFDRKFGDAMREVEKALQSRPNWPEALVLRGVLKAELNDHLGAIADWEAAERKNVAEGRSIDLNERGLALSVVGRTPEAIQVFERVPLDDRHPVMRYNLAVARATIDGVEACRPELEAVDELIRDFEDAVASAYGQGGICCLLSQDAAAYEFLARALQNDVKRDQVRRWAETDPAWQRLRDSAEFKSVIEGVARD